MVTGTQECSTVTTTHRHSMQELGLVGEKTVLGMEAWEALHSQIPSFKISRTIQTGRKGGKMPRTEQFLMDGSHGAHWFLPMENCSIAAQSLTPLGLQGCALHLWCGCSRLVADASSKVQEVLILQGLMTVPLAFWTGHLKKFNHS